MRLLASDFDNTLWFKDHMKDNDVKAIQAFQKKENLFGVCSGRSLNGIITPSLPYHLEYDFYILLSGALILNKDKEVIFEKTIPMSLVKDIFAFTDQKDMSVVYQDIMYRTNAHDNYCVYLESLDKLQTDAVSAISFHFQADEIEQARIMCENINQQFGDVIEAYQNNQHIDLAAKGCSKGNGMKMIQDYFQLSINDIYGIGDSWNDLPMLDVIKNGYTFTYAPDVVKQHAKYVVSSLAECIEDIETKS